LGIVVGGVGGTGVITIGQLLGMAAHIEGKGVVTQDAGGLAQKGGATWSHIQIAARPDAIFTTKVDTAQADLVIACDAIVGASKYTMTVMQLGRTFVALTTHGTPTAASCVTDQFGHGHEAAVLATLAIPSSAPSTPSRWRCDHQRLRLRIRDARLTGSRAASQSAT
jgi:Pyruvate/2-oxoacid:ferredoxin oxidoreductase gamma subunit